MTSLRNNFYYVLLVVPAQTVLALGLALVLNQQLLKARGFFRTAFYFPSVTSSVAISLVFLFLFTGGGAVNSLLGVVGIDGPDLVRRLARPAAPGSATRLGLWDIAAPPAALTGTVGARPVAGGTGCPGRAWRCRVIIMLVVWTTTGTFMLMFLAALQDVPVEVEEAARIDGASRWQSFRASRCRTCGPPCCW